MTNGADVAHWPVRPDADMQQAEYFWRMLDGRKADLCELLEGQLDALASYQSAGDLGGVRRHRRIVEELESELRTIDRMLLALRVRLGLPTLRRTL